MMNRFKKRGYSSQREKILEELQIKCDQFRIKEINTHQYLDESSKLLNKLKGFTLNKYSSNRMRYFLTKIKKIRSLVGEN